MCFIQELIDVPALQFWALTLGDDFSNEFSLGPNLRFFLIFVLNYEKIRLIQYTPLRSEKNHIGCPSLFLNPSVP